MSTSASRTEQWLMCPASEALPQAKTAGGEAATRGKAIHSFLERVAKEGPVKALEWANTMPAEYAAACRALPLDELPVDAAQYSSELWMGQFLAGADAPYSAFVTTDLGHYIGTLAGAERPMERAQATAWLDKVGCYFGCADVAAVDIENKRGLIADYKTGHGVVSSPANNWQIRGLAWLLSVTHGLSEVEGQIILLDRDEPYVMRCTFTKQNLEEIGKEILVGLARVQAARAKVAKGEVPTVYPGEWCNYCPAFWSCPSKVALTEALVRDPDAVVAEVKEALSTPNMVGVAYLRLKPVMDLVMKLHALVKEAATNVGGASLPDGKVYGPVEVVKREIDAEKGHGALSAAISDGVANVALESTMTFASVERAVADYVSGSVELGPNTTKAALMRTAEAALEKAGAITRKVETQVRVHRP